MNYEDLTLKQLKEISSLFNSNENFKENEDSHWEIGQTYLIRTVTMTEVGKLKKVTDKELVLSDAAWIPETVRFSESLIPEPVRFSESLRSGNFEEVEMFKEKEVVIVGRGAIVDAQKIDLDLTKLQTK